MVERIERLVGAHLCDNRNRTLAQTIICDLAVLYADLVPHPRAAYVPLCSVIDCGHEEGDVAFASRWGREEGEKTVGQSLVMVSQLISTMVMVP